MKKVFVIFCAILFALTILPNAFALTYRSDVDNGSWSQYTAGLTSYYYQASTLGQRTYNRDFEDNFSMTTSGSCASGWCFMMQGDCYSTQVTRSSDYSSQGTYSVKIEGQNAGGGCNVYLFGEQELVSDSNIIFDKIGNTNVIYYGYYNDSNSFNTVGNVSTAGTYSYLIPAGKYRVGFWKSSGVGSTHPVYVDNIKVLRNNAGTFSKNVLPNTCTSISDCSNIIEHFTGSPLSSTYWVVDYVAGGSCNYGINGDYSNNMIAGSNGMFYANISTVVSGTSHSDVGLSAFCTKTGFTSKGFSASPIFFKYNLIDNGSFEDVVSKRNSGCENNWCAVGVGSDYCNYLPYTAVQSSRDYAFEGVYSYKIHAQTTGGACNITTWNTGAYQGGSTITFERIYGDNIVFYYGYVNDSNTFTQVGQTSQIESIAYDIPAGNYRVAFSKNNSTSAEVVYIDSVSSSSEKDFSSLVATNSLVANVGVTGTLYNFYSSYRDDSNVAITGATCTMSIGGDVYSSTYSAGKYVTQFGFISDGTYSVIHSCSSAVYNTATTSYSVTIGAGGGGTSALSVTPISNVSNVSIDGNGVNFNPSNQTAELIFSAVTTATSTPAIFRANTNYTGIDKQYFIYTSTDGSSWVFNETLTFGTDYSNGVQKIFTGNGYYYSFSDTLYKNVRKYYKMIFQNVSASWGTIKSSADWRNYNMPTLSVEEFSGSSLTKAWDLFADSNYSRVASRTTKFYPDLTSVDLNTGFYLQFTGYASAVTTLNVGYADALDGVLHGVDVNVLTTKKTFSVPIDASSNEDYLGFASFSSGSANVYLSDFVIVPRSYFASNLEVLTKGGQKLPAIIMDVDGVLVEVNAGENNRSFESGGYLFDVGGIEDGVCSDDWCYLGAGGGKATKSSFWATDGIMSGVITSITNALFFANTESAGGHTVTFDYYCMAEADLNYGYVNDSNVFTLVGTAHGSGSYSYDVPVGSYRVAWNETSGAMVQIFLDNIRYWSLGASTRTSVQYLSEGVGFKVKTSAYDISGDLSKLRVEAMIGGTVVKSYEYALSLATDYGAIFSWNSLLEGVIDLNGDRFIPSDLRNITLRATLINDAGKSVAEQSSTYKLLQYPYYPSDFGLVVSNLNTRVGDYPKFRFELRQLALEFFNGFQIRIYDATHSYANPNAWMDVTNNDLACGVYCLKDVAFDDFVWESEKTYTVAVVSKLGTQNRLYLADNLVNKVFKVTPSYADYVLKQIVQTYERQSSVGVAGMTYRSFEPLPLVVRLADSSFNDLTGNVEVYLRVEECTAQYPSGVCGDRQLTRFYPRKAVYEAKSGLNLFFFKEVFYLDNGDLLHDGNYFKFVAYIVDKTQTHSLEVSATTLVDKCKSYPPEYNQQDLLDYFLVGVNVLTDSNFTRSYHSGIFGCTENSSAMIDSTTSPEQKRIFINDDYNIQGGQNQSLICFNSDWNISTRNKDISSDLDCMLFYTKGEMSVDKFSIKVGNEYSSLSESDAVKGQYIGFDVLEDEIILNDAFAMQKALSTNYGTNIDTVGDFVVASFDKFSTPFANYLFKTKQNVGSVVAGGTYSFLTGQEFLRNVNWDVNFQNKISPNYINTVIFFKVKGFKVTNQDDYLDQYPELIDVPSNALRSYALANGLIIKSPTTVVELVSANNLLLRKMVLPSPIIINLTQSEGRQVQSIVDENSLTQTVPNTLNFSLVSDMVYGNGAFVDRILLPFRVEYVLPAKPFNLLEGIVSLLIGENKNNDNQRGDSSSGENAGILQDPPAFILQNWFVLFILVIFILLVSLIYANFMGGGLGNISINNHLRR
jgi:hypothetical protein